MQSKKSVSFQIAGFVATLSLVVLSGCGASEDKSTATALTQTATAAPADAPAPNAPAGAAPSAVAPSSTAPSAVPPATTAPATTLLSRLVINPPAFNHQPVSEVTIEAIKKTIQALPEPLRTKLDQSDARVIISPNMIDRWPDSVRDLPESNPAPTLAEQPGRIYGRDMCVYERPKKRGTTDLGPARAPEFLQLHVGDMCFQVLDDMENLSKDPTLRQEWNEDKKDIPADVQPKMANFMKLDDWGPRETCAEMFGSMMGGRNENTDNLYKYFPRVKKWLITRLGITGQS